jgi:hypothetical protein
MEIEIKTIPHEGQRYETVGDWLIFKASKGLPPPVGEFKLLVRVSDMGDWRKEALVAVHELVEALLCHARHISDESVTAFDLAFNGSGEPGDDPACPYRKEHFFATSVERLLAAEFGVDWIEYDSSVANVGCGGSGE